MIVRLTYLNFLPDKLDEAKKTYNEEVVSVVKKQKGNLDCKLLEPANKTDDHISMTVWETKEDAVRALKFVLATNGIKHEDPL